MIWTVFGLAALGLIVWGTHRLRTGYDEKRAAMRHPKGWLAPLVRIDDALDVADRHLPAARAGANVRLQYGNTGCLTMIRRKPRGGGNGYRARWEFWRPDAALAHRLLDLGAARVGRPQRDVLELDFADDYSSFRQAMERAFDGQPLEVGNMHLTWNC